MKLEKLTISMAMFQSDVTLPEGHPYHTHNWVYPYLSPFPMPGVKRPGKRQQLDILSALIFARDHGFASVFAMVCMYVYIFIYVCI